MKDSTKIIHVCDTCGIEIDGDTCTQHLDASISSIRTPEETLRMHCNLCDVYRTYEEHALYCSTCGSSLTYAVPQEEV